MGEGNEEGKEEKVKRDKGKKKENREKRKKEKGKTEKEKMKKGHSRIVGHHPASLHQCLGLQQVTEVNIYYPEDGDY